MRTRSAASRSVFVDTSAHCALSARLDAHHVEATALLARLGRERRPLYTTNFIVAETHGLLLSRLRRAYTAGEARALARVTVAALYRSTITIERVTLADEQRALALLERYADQDFSFVDATSFALMERLGISIAFTFDDDFQKIGFTDLRHLFT